MKVAIRLDLSVCVRVCVRVRQTKSVDDNDNQTNISVIIWFLITMQHAVG